eukprot:6184440-Pleurochrysis_carterae.AAC.3
MERSGLVRSASLTREGRSSAAGAWVLWKVRGTPSGEYVSTRCVMYFSCLRVTQFDSAEMSAFSKSEMGPSFSTIQREARSEAKRWQRDPSPSWEYSVNRSST